MFGLGGDHNKSTYGVLIDIGSGSVGVAVVKSDPKQKLPDIIFSHRVFTRIKSKPEKAEEHMREVREALFSANLILLKDGILALREHHPKAHITKILVSCSSPWAKTISKNVTYSHDNEIKVTASVIQDLIKTAEDEINNHLDEQNNIGSKGFDVIEKATVNIKINGYTVHHPIGLKGKTLEISHVVGLLPEEILSSIYEIQDKVFVDTEVTAHSFMLILYCVLRDLYPKNESLSLINITAEATELGVVKDGLLLETFYMPHGSNTLIRKIISNTNETPESALSLLRLYTDGNMSKEEQAGVRLVLDNYLTHLSVFLSDIHERHTIPGELVITAQPHLEKLLKNEVLKTVSEITKTKTSVYDLATVFSETRPSGHNSDVFISLSSRFFHKLHGCGEIDLP